MPKEDLFMPEEDVILPDDFEATPAPEAEVEQEQEQEVEVAPEAEDTKPAEETTEPIVDTPKLKIKYNHEEKEISLEEATALAQKGLNYEKAIERAQQEAAQQARDAWIVEQGYTWNGKTITTESEYRQATAEQDLINKYQDRDMPPEVIQELVESRRFRESHLQERQQSEAKAREDAHLFDFLNYFKASNERDFDPAKDKIPQEVWEASNKGVPLKYAYMEHHTKELQTKVKVIKQNESNKQKAPVGSVTAHGSNEVAADDDFMKGFNSI
jgi:hypothetical protein